MFKKIRILLLLTVLLFVAVSAYTLDANLKDWSKTKWVAIYPINADASLVTADYISKLTDADFDVMQDFLNAEAARYGVSTSLPFRVLLGPVVTDHPPAAPQHGQWYENMWWSLKLRLWASELTEQLVAGPPADIKIYVEYYDPAKYAALPHSVGMKKLSLAVVKAFSTKKMSQTNSIIMTHELLHVFGASDKYDLNTSLPSYPEGYAEPNKTPLYPQQYAEIMGGRIPVSKTEATIPNSFKTVSLSELTAREIGWVK